MANLKQNTSYPLEKLNSIRDAFKNGSFAFEGKEHQTSSFADHFSAGAYNIIPTSKGYLIGKIHLRSFSFGQFFEYNNVNERKLVSGPLIMPSGEVVTVHNTVEFTEARKTAGKMLKDDAVSEILLKLEDKYTVIPYSSTFGRFILSCSETEFLGFYKAVAPISKVVQGVTHIIPKFITGQSTFTGMQRREMKLFNLGNLLQFLYASYLYMKHDKIPQKLHFYMNILNQPGTNMAHIEYITYTNNPLLNRLCEQLNESNRSVTMTKNKKLVISSGEFVQFKEAAFKSVKGHVITESAIDEINVFTGFSAFDGYLFNNRMMSMPLTTFIGSGKRAAFNIDDLMKNIQLNEDEYDIADSHNDGETASFADYDEEDSRPMAVVDHLPIGAMLDKQVVILRDGTKIGKKAVHSGQYFIYQDYLDDNATSDEAKSQTSDLKKEETNKLGDFYKRKPKMSS